MVVDFVTFDNISYLFPQRKPFKNRKLKFRAKIKQRIARVSHLSQLKNMFAKN